MIERSARIFNIQKYSVYDGPGIRTLVFFKGCPLRCKWCSNPEGMEKKYQVMYLKDKCVGCGACVPVCPAGIHRFQNTAEGHCHTVDRGVSCTGCGKCVEACHQRALSIAGREITVSEALESVQQDEVFYHTSGGGVTLGGGEPSMQPEFATNLLMECRLNGIRTAIETCGYTKLDVLLKIAEFTDLFLYDVKHIDSASHYEWTGVRNEIILENLQELIRRRYSVKVRMPLMKGVNDDADAIRRTAELLLPYKEYRNFLGVDLLAYHKLGINKYRQLDMTYPIHDDLSLTKEDLGRIDRQIGEYNFPVKIIRH